MDEESKPNVPLEPYVPHANRWINPWTPERVEELSRRWAAGEAAGPIAKSMGTTRSGILGKISRLGLTRRGRSTTIRATPWVAEGITERQWYRRRQRANQEASQGQGEAPQRRSKTFIIAGNRVQPAKWGGPELTRLAPKVPNHPVTFLELKDHHCHWPYEPEGEAMMYCGEIAHQGKPYCTAHCHAAYDYRR